MEGAKKYGLFLKKDLSAVSNQLLKKPSVFNEDSDVEEESNVDWVKKALQKEPYSGGARTRLSKAEIQKVLNEDPTAFQYDEVYDEIEKKRVETVEAEKTDRKPKYIQNLLATAERRKRENERRLARQIQKERETEGDEFADKEVFVTSAYKKKLEEIRQMDEEDQHMEMLEDIGDVTKQKDISGFYRHLYSITFDKDSRSEKYSKVKSTRQYRKRKSSVSSDNDENPPQEKAIEAVTVKIEPGENVDADPINTSSEKNENEFNTSKSEEAAVEKNSRNEKMVTTENEDNKENIGQKSKVSIWVKRTINDVYDAALQRYFERKSQRLADNGS